MNYTKYDPNGIRNLIFDLDDTILKCSGHYEDCKIAFLDFQEKRTGLAPTLIRNVLEAIDTTGGQLHTFTKERWPMSFGAASAALDALQGHKVDREATKKSYDIGNVVFACDYEPIEGAIAILETYHNCGYNLILYTKGDIGVQKRKIAKNDLGRFFSPANTHIVSLKNGDAVRKIINEQYIMPAETILVGDNFREDVQSALDAKITPVHINTELKTEGKRFRMLLLDDNVIDCLHSIADLPIIVPPISLFAASR